MRVLAFDPGYERLGVAVLEKKNGKEILLYSSCLRTAKTKAFAERLAELGANAEALIEQWKPGAVALEEVFFEKNAKTAMQIAEVRGMLTYIASSRGLPAHQYTPGEVKVAITGSGRGNKRAIALMVPRLLALSSRKRLDDELDAVAVGITCLASLR